MIRHCVKLAWNRKRANALVIFEILVSFLVLFSVILIGMQFHSHYRSELGFAYDDVFGIVLESGEERFSDADGKVALQQLVRQVMTAIRELPEVEFVAASSFLPYFGGATFYLEDGTVGFEVSDSFAEAMQLSLVEGRWFRPDDDQLDWVPVVLTERLSRARFGGESPLGQVFSGEGEKETRVVGVVSEFRRGGDFAPPENLGFWRMSLSRSDRSFELVPYLLVRAEAGLDASFEERLVAKLRAAAPDWSFEVNLLPDMRSDSLSFAILPLAIGGVIVGFLMLMVALGLLGVLWQSVGSRTREIGLRKAHGATSIDICSLVIGETLGTSALAVGLGAGIILQLPVLDLIGSFDWGTYTVSVLCSAFLIFLLTFLCALYPSWLACRVHPVVALHHE